MHIIHAILFIFRLITGPENFKVKTIMQKTQLIVFEKKTHRRG